MDRESAVVREIAAAGHGGDLGGVEDVRAVRGAEAGQRRKIEARGAAVAEEVEPARGMPESVRGAAPLPHPELAPRAVPPMDRLVLERDPITLGLHSAPEPTAPRG